jgi:Family of unknown function (DUF6807)
MIKPHAIGSVLLTIVCTGAAAGLWLAVTSETVSSATDPAPQVQVVAREADRRVDITIGGKPFTSYIWPTTIKKPVLFPLRSAQGTELTRGFPLVQRAGERVDHPHHVGMWLNYGSVNGLDFWNNSEAIKPEEQPKYGSIEHKSIVNVKSGAGRGELVVNEDWVGPDKSVLLKEDTRYIFHALGDVRMIDRITTLTVQDKPVTFGESKEGVLGIRVRRQLEDPAEKGDTFTDGSGKPTKVEAMDSKGVTGAYLTSEGKKGAEAWGTKGRWCALSGTVDDEPVTIAILDHPKNPNHPTYWHARGYGLFAANGLGGQQFDKNVPPRSLTVQPGQQVKFIYRVLLLHGTPTVRDLNTRYTDFTKDLQ